MTTADLDDMTELLGDPQVMEHYPRPKDRDEAAGWIEWNLRSYATYGYGLWIVETHDGEFIGDCGLIWQQVNDSAHLEVGYHVKTSAQNLDYATEAATACRDHARSQALSSRLVSIIHQHNRASQRVAEKIGMSLDRRLKHSSPIHLVYALDL